MSVYKNIFVHFTGLYICEIFIASIFEATSVIVLIILKCLFRYHLDVDSYWDDAYGGSSINAQSS